MVSVVIHTNLNLHNQQACADWLQKGFKRHGITAVVTGDKKAPADVHVIQGPHYAYREWVGKPNVLWLNRCFYGHDFYDLSLGWLNADGTREWFSAPEAHGELPELQPMKERQGKDACAVVFNDYGTDAMWMVQDARSKYGRVYYRGHPADRREAPCLAPDWTLDETFEIADVAVGNSSTVLVQAAINGLHVDCHDPLNVAHGIEDRQAWLEWLSWGQWSHKELANGDFWGHLNV